MALEPTPTKKLIPDAAGRATPGDDQFAAADDEAAFEAAAAQLAAHAATRVTDLREAITSYSSAATSASAATLWMHPKAPDLNSGIAAGLAGDAPTSQRQLTAYLDRVGSKGDDDFHAIERRRP